MIKHFCDICDKYLTVCNKVLSDTALITRELDGMNRPLQGWIIRMLAKEQERVYKKYFEI